MNNLEKCNASCCKVLVFNIKLLSKDMKKYYEHHGVKIIKYGRGYRAIVPVNCLQLDENNLCKLHNTKDKPRCCVNLVENNTSSYYLTEGCMLKNAKS